MEHTVAIVTGAAGGIGYAVAQALGACGVVVAAVDSDTNRVQECAAKLNAEGLRVEAFGADVTSSEQVDSVVAAVESRLGPIDFLVNNAGVLNLGEVRHTTDEDWANTLAVNLTGVFYVSRAVLNRMVPRAQGALVTVASNAANTPRIGMSAYAASKAAATMLTKCVGLEAAEHGIRCNLVAPGSTKTPMLSSMWHDESGPRETIAGRPDTFRVGIPMAKLACPSDVAAAVVFLLSEQAGHITMQELTVDGGAGLGV